MKKSLLILVLALTSLPAAAQIYKCKDKAGNTIYALGIPEGCAAPAKGSRAARTPSPADFPRVSPELQQARDSTRRGILENELANERLLLASASSDKTYLHERNIKAINRELANMR